MTTSKAALAGSRSAGAAAYIRAMADQDDHVPTREVLDVDDEGNPITLWKIAIRDDIRASMVTDPSPYWAKDESERDWYLAQQLKRPREDYDVVEVPGPVERALDDERARFDRVRRELWEARKRR
jgi:hypothetical protein